MIKLNYNQQLFKKLFYYDETSPSGLRYLNENNSFGNAKRYKDDVVGTIRHNKKSDKKVWIAKVNKIPYVIHRVVWYIVNGELSEEKVIDHIDGNPLNNKIANLRLVSFEINCRNQARQKNNSSGKTGVHFDGNYWVAQWNENGKRKKKKFKLFKSASEYRDKMIEKIGGYIERHGTINGETI